MQTLISEFAATVLPALVQLIAATLGVLMIRAANVARDRWGIEIEARHREALHSALMSGVRAALMNGLTAPQAVSFAVEHAQNSVPDALRSLRPSSDVLLSIARAKLEEALPLYGAKKDG